MGINVHFTDKTVAFCTEIEPHQRFDAVLVADNSITRAKILKILETCNRIAVLSTQPQMTFGNFSRDFRCVAAAGGVVTNPQGEVLMMQRRGRWDLPKGHIEPDEQSNQCARREVAEETGISHTKVQRLVCNTYHAYNLGGEWELKRTQWFDMPCDGLEKPQPQHEEGIDRVQWIPRTMLSQCLSNTYPTIREVIDAFYGQQHFEAAQ